MRTAVRYIWRGFLLLATVFAICALIFYAYWCIVSARVGWQVQRDSPAIAAVAHLDQLDRYGLLYTPFGLAFSAFAINERDTQRRSLVQQLEQRGELVSGADFAHAALIWQHGSTPDHYAQANQYAARAIKLGSEPGRWLYAATRDRYLLSIGEPQQFGTQYTFADGAWQLQPVDPATTDAERAHYGVAPLTELQQGLGLPLYARIESILAIQILTLIGTLNLIIRGLQALKRVLVHKLRRFQPTRT